MDTPIAATTLVLSTSPSPDEVIEGTTKQSAGSFLESAAAAAVPSSLVSVASDSLLSAAAGPRSLESAAALSFLLAASAPNSDPSLAPSLVKTLSGSSTTSLMPSLMKTSTGSSTTSTGGSTLTPSTVSSTSEASSASSFSYFSVIGNSTASAATSSSSSSSSSSSNAAGGRVFSFESPTINWQQLTPLSDCAPMGGGMGLVLKATLKRARETRGRLVAVKLLYADALGEGASFESSMSALEREASTLREAAYMNKYVVQVYGLVRGKASKAVYDAVGPKIRSVLTNGELIGMVMDWADGGTLSDLLYKRFWSAGTPEKLQLCAHITEGVAGLHEGESLIIHGDIKSQNVLLQQGGAKGGAAFFPLLADFGLSELRSAAEKSMSALSSLCVATERKGTLAYKAPEMLESVEDERPIAPASRSTDVYATATLIWEVLTGQSPWKGISDVKRALQASQGKILPLTSPPLPADTPPSIVEALARCLSPDRSQRLRAGALAALLQQETDRMSSGKFDVFLSHAWSPDGKHEAITTEVYRCLISEGYRVWIDKTEMTYDIEDSMQRGIENSTCVVALLRKRYCSRPNCKFELQHAKSIGKPIIACRTDPDDITWFPCEEIAELINSKIHLMANLNAAAAVNWAAHEDLGNTAAAAAAATKVAAGGGGPSGASSNSSSSHSNSNRSSSNHRDLLKAPEALPRVLQLVKHVLESGGSSRTSSGGSFKISGTVAPPHPLLLPSVSELSVLTEAVSTSSTYSTSSSVDASETPSPTSSAASPQLGITARLRSFHAVSSIKSGSNSSANSSSNSSSPAPPSTNASSSSLSSSSSSVAAVPRLTRSSRKEGVVGASSSSSSSALSLSAAAAAAAAAAPPPQSSRPVRLVPPANLDKLINLAKNWSDEIDPTGYSISEKIDGQRALFKDGQLWSRGSNLVKAPAWFLASLPPGMVLDGELFGGRGRIHETTSVLRRGERAEDEWRHDIRYLILDAPCNPGNFVARITAADAALRAHAAAARKTLVASGKTGAAATASAATASAAAEAGGKSPPPIVSTAELLPIDELFFPSSHAMRPPPEESNVSILPHIICRGREHLSATLARIHAKGGEGIMLRRLDTPHRGGRNADLLKVKTSPTLDDEAVVVGIEAGWTLATLHLRLRSGKGFVMATGFSERERAELPSIVKVGETIVRLCYKETTADGLPRLPTFKGIRDDLSTKDFSSLEPLTSGAASSAAAAASSSSSTSYFAAAAAAAAAASSSSSTSYFAAAAAAAAASASSSSHEA